MTTTEAPYKWKNERPGTVSLLFKAVSVGQQNMVEFLIAQGYNPLAFFIGASPPLRPHHVAALYGHTALLEWLVDHYPIPLYAEPGPGFSVLYLAASEGYMDTVRLLIEKGADPRRRSGSGMLTSELAERNGHAAIAAYLREQEAVAEEAEAALARRARNEKRRQKQKKAKARRAAATAAAAAGIGRGRGRGGGGWGRERGHHGGAGRR